MNNLNASALIPMVFSMGSMISIAFGNPVLGAVFSNPNTANAATAVVGGVGALVSAFLPSIIKKAS